MEFRLVPAGSFRMGSRGEYADEEPVHVVQITRPFYLGATPVTQQQWRTLVEHQSPSEVKLNPAPSEFKGAQRPVETVSWRDAIAWCELLSKHPSCVELLESIEPQMGTMQVGLPTEAQWEYACVWRHDGSHLTGIPMEYFTGDGPGALDLAGWFDENSKNQTQAVRKKVANDLGLYDMQGNVWEWCWDDYDSTAYQTRVDGVADPCHPPRDSPRDDNALRVVRGGSWVDSAWGCRAACRDWRGPVGRFGNRGFRVCLFPGPVPSPANRKLKKKASRRRRL